jgi:hypothetical protein
MTDILTLRNGLGAAIGSAVGFVLAGGPFGASIGALLGGAVAHTSGVSAQRGELTPKRKLIFQRAMETIKDPKDLVKIADAFAAEGLKDEALALRKRAKLRGLSKEERDKRSYAYKKAMSSDNPEAIDKLADAFLHDSSFTAARNLKEHANAVRAAQAAGKSGKPQPSADLEAFAERLMEAVAAFGPESKQARAAARNLISAQGKQPVDSLTTAAIQAAVAELPATAAPVSAEVQEKEVQEDKEGTQEDTVPEGAVAPAGGVAAPVGGD